MDIFGDIDLAVFEQTDKLASHETNSNPKELGKEEQVATTGSVSISPVPPIVSIPNTFEQALVDSRLKWKPLELGFIPSNFWRDEDKTFGQMYLEFFRRKNNSNCRFPHKLYNALLLTELFSGFERIVGVEWVNDHIIKVDRCGFAKLLGIRSIDGSLFHQQGNFPTHGFVEVDPAMTKSLFPNFDFQRYRLIEHKGGVFVKGCTELDINQCKWRIEKE